MGFRVVDIVTLMFWWFAGAAIVAEKEKKFHLGNILVKLYSER